MNVVVFTACICAVLSLVAVFFFLYAMSSFAYPQSRTTVEVYPTDHRPPRRWRPICVQGGIGLLATGIVFLLCDAILLPVWKEDETKRRLNEAEGVTRSTFKNRMGQEPPKIKFEDNDPRSLWMQFWNAPWQISGSAWLTDNDEWEVIVTKTGRFGNWETECRAQRRLKQD